MVTPSVPNTFANSTAADATAVNNNFAALVGALTNGLNDLSVLTFTAAGNVILGTLGSSTISLKGSINESIRLAANNTLDLGGSATGWQSIYLGGPTSLTTRIRAHQSLGGSNTIVLPNGAASSADSYLSEDGSGNWSWKLNLYNANEKQNISVVCTVDVGNSTMTFTLADRSGNALSSTNQARISFQSGATPGAIVTRTISSNISVTTVNTATLGLVASTAKQIFCYAIDNAGTVELAVSCLPLQEGNSTINTTAMSTSADLANVVYSTTARTGVYWAPLAKAIFTLSSPGAWASSPSSQGQYGLPMVTRNDVCAMYSTNAGQSIPNGAETVVDYGNKIYDPLGSVTTGASWVYTAPFDGVYALQAIAQFDSAAWTAGQEARFYLYGPGSFAGIIIDTSYVDVVTTRNVMVKGGAILYMAAGATVHVRLYQVRGSSTAMAANNATNYIHISRIAG